MADIRPHGINIVTTDNVAHMVVTVRESGLNQHIGCFAHSINLASQRAIKLTHIDRLLGRIRRIVGYFQRSPKAAILKEKLVLLEIHKPTGPRKLIMVVSTRGDSTFDMLDRYLLFKPAVMAALISKECYSLVISLKYFY